LPRHAGQSALHQPGPHARQCTRAGMLRS
jgi:hypothetical protein